MTQKKKSVARKTTNKNSRKKSSKVSKDECPDSVCVIKTKKQTPKPENTKSVWGRFLDLVFPSRLKNE